MLRSTTTISSNGPTKKGVSPDFVFKHLNSSVNIDTLTCFTDFSESFIDIGLQTRYVCFKLYVKKRRLPKVKNITSTALTNNPSIH
jgi:hypothetical protein